MAYVTIEALSNAVENLENNLGKFSNVLYQDKDESSSSSDVHISFTGDISTGARYQLERLQFIAKKDYLTANGSATVVLHNELSGASQSYNMRIIVDGAMTTLTDGAYKSGYIYSLYYLNSGGTPYFILYSQDYSSYDTRLSAVEQSFQNSAQYITRQYIPAYELYAQVLNPTVTGLPQDALVATAVKSYSALYSQNFADDGLPGGTVSFNGQINLFSATNIEHPVISEDWHIVSKKYFEDHAADLITAEYNSKFVADTRTPAEYELEVSEVEDGTIYLQLEIV